MYTQKSCLDLHDYLKTILNPYIINVTLAAKMCSQTLCQNQGVCSRKDWNSNDYLHLNPQNFQIHFVKHGKYEIRGNPTLENLLYFSQKFRCSCFAHLNCQERADIESVSTVSVCTLEDICINSLVISDKSELPKDWNRPYFVNSNQSDITSSATVSPCVPRKDVSGYLVVLSLYSQHLKYSL
ncbi:hyaluronidase-5 isoform c [Mus musculus]|uniref:hyaluronidase-5 isoform c n=1 Tax=Mus musculus TaxID=10090 RepID=UPI0023AFF423|nr:hyaluronidase-5 isoform c [Mus musculus]